MTGSRRIRAVATLGRATLEAGKKAGPLRRVLDEAARPEVKQGTADEIFFTQSHTQTEHKDNQPSVIRG